MADFVALHADVDDNSLTNIGLVNGYIKRTMCAVPHYSSLVTKRAKPRFWPYFRITITWYVGFIK